MKTTSKKLSCLVSPFLLGKKHLYIYRWKKTYLFATTSSHSHSYSLCFQVTSGAGFWRRCFLSARNVAVAENSNPKPPGNWKCCFINPPNELPKTEWNTYTTYIDCMSSVEIFIYFRVVHIQCCRTVALWHVHRKWLLDTPPLKISQ